MDRGYWYWLVGEVSLVCCGRGCTPWRSGLGGPPLCGLVLVWGNRYSVPPAVIGTEVIVRWRLGDPIISILSASGRLVATHRKVP